MSMNEGHLVQGMEIEETRKPHSDIRSLLPTPYGVKVGKTNSELKK
jgi:hypothetical protein